MVDADRRRIALAFDVLTLPAGSGGSGHEKVSVVLVDVDRVVASHRLGRWDDDEAVVLPFGHSELSAVVRAFGGSSVYGWEFFDTPDEHWTRWSNRLSLDEQWTPGVSAHTIELFQEGHIDGSDHHLDFRAWFDRLEVHAEDGRPISLDEFAAGGKRWWDAMNAGDVRTSSAGIYPAKPDLAEASQRPALRFSQLRWPLRTRRRP
ncbi:MAG: hypothetical protein R2707_07725 [Acidimicrobiales bacterium]